MHHEQLDIDIHTARQLVHSQFPQYRNDEVVRVESSGTDNHIFRIGSKLVARFPIRGTDVDLCLKRLRSEVSAMRELHRVCPFPTSQPIGLGQPSAFYPMPWAIQTWIEGEVATPTIVSGSTAFAYDLVHLVSALRQADVAGRVFDGSGRGGSIAGHDAWMEECLVKSEGHLDVILLRKMWAKFRELPASGPDVMSHRDLTPANLLIDADRIVGVLDGGSFGPADRSLDYVVAWHLLDDERREVFRNALQIDELDWKRGAAWAFQQAMGLVWYYHTSNPAMSALGHSTISRLLCASPV